MILRVLFYLGYFTICAIAVCAIGAVVGIILHLAYWLMFVSGEDWTLYMKLGLKHGLIYGGVWAGGTALVLTVIKLNKDYSFEPQAKY